MTEPDQIRPPEVSDRQSIAIDAGKLTFDAAARTSNYDTLYQDAVSGQPAAAGAAGAVDGGPQERSRERGQPG